MPLFRYEAFSSEGMSRKGSVDAPNESHARQLLQQTGLRVVTIRSSGQPKTVSTLARFRPTRRVDPERLFADLTVLLDAGLGLERALKALSESGDRNKDAALTILEAISSGTSPSDAFRSLPQVTEEVCALISSGERTGKLASVFTMVSSDLKRQRQQKSQVFEAISYPIFLLLMMLFAVLLITFSLIPAILPIFESANRQPPLLVSILGTFGDILTEWGGILALLLIPLILLLMTKKNRETGRLLLRQAGPRIPVFGSLAKKHIIVRYLRSLSLSLGNGIEMQKALDLGAKTCTFTSYRAIFNDMREEVIMGNTFTDAMRSASIFPSSVVSLTAIGDAVNGLPNVLARSADIIDAEATQLQNRLLSFLSPAITIVMGLLIGSLVISVMSALLSINEMSLQ